MSFIKILTLIIFIFTANCSGNKVSNYHGVKSLEKKFDQLKINITNKNDLITIIGPPSVKSDFNKNKWYYIERLKTNQSLFKLGTQKLKTNNILVVELSNSGILISKKFLKLENMNDIKYLKKETKKDFQDKNALYDVFSSLREKINAPLRRKN
tara:strand:+ start:595 stop:1056 length:462 start_codon:yes stop_codon:yes gene_type:complete